MNVLLLKNVTADNELLWPWEQHDALRVDLDLHAKSCGVCSLAAVRIFDTHRLQDTISVNCLEGRTLAKALLRAKFVGRV
jgi:hypothetical protein